MTPNYLKSLRIVYFSLAMGIVLFVLVSVFLISINGPFAQPDLSYTEKAPFLIVLVVLTGAVFITYRVIFPKKLEVIKTLPTLDQKLAAWRELYILRGALIEAPSFFAIVLFLLLGISALLIWPIAGIMLFWITQPTRDKLAKDTNLSPDEIGEFDGMQ